MTPGARSFRWGVLPAVAGVLWATACAGSTSSTTPPTTPQTTFHVDPTTTAALIPCTVRRPDLPEQDLPPEVAEARRRIYLAAAGCDFQGLSDLVAGADRPVLGYGGPSACRGDPVAFWEALVEEMGGDPMHLIAGTLELPYARVEVGEAPGGERPYYLWPAVVGQDAPAEADWDELRTLYRDEQVDLFRSDPAGRSHIFLVCLPAGA